jgi:hypothetical protein
VDATLSALSLEEQSYMYFLQTEPTITKVALLSTKMTRNHTELLVLALCVHVVALTIITRTEACRLSWS